MKRLSDTRLGFCTEDGSERGDGLPLGEDEASHLEVLCGNRYGMDLEEAMEFISMPWLLLESNPEHGRRFGDRSASFYSIVTDPEACFRWFHKHGGMTDEDLELWLAKLTLEQLEG